MAPAVVTSGGDQVLALTGTLIQSSRLDQCSRLAPTDLTSPSQPDDKHSGHPSSHCFDELIYVMVHFNRLLRKKEWEVRMSSSLCSHVMGCIFVSSVPPWLVDEESAC